MAENEDDRHVEDQQQATEQPKADEALEHWKSMSRKNERAAKEAARERDEANARLAEYEAKVAEYEARRARDEAVARVAADTGLPEQVVRGLRGETAEEIGASAEALRQHYHAYPLTRDEGPARGPAKATAAQLFASALDGMI